MIVGTHINFKVLLPSADPYFKDSTIILNEVCMRSGNDLTTIYMGKAWMLLSLTPNLSPITPSNAHNLLIYL